MLLFGKDMTILLIIVVLFLLLGGGGNLGFRRR
jgi:hypothetical protein